MNSKRNALIKFFSNAALIAVFVFLFGQNLVSSAHAQSGNYEVTSFTSDIHFSSIGADVTERIVTNFNIEKHGIYRYLPQLYQYFDNEGKEQFSRLKINVQSVTNEAGTPWDFTTYEQKFSTFDARDLFNGLFQNQFVIQIGDANKTITGAQTYVIKYQIQNFPTNPSPLSYGVTGNGWDVPLKNVTVNLTFVQTPSDLRAVYGNKSTLGTKQTIRSLDKNTYKILLDSVDSGSGIQIFFNGITFSHPDSDTKIFLLDYWYIVIPPLFLIGLFLYWFFYARAPKGTGVIVPQFSIPENLSPAEVGTLYDDSVDKIDISATIIDLAVRKHIKISNVSENTKKADFVLTLLENPDPLKDYEKTLISGLFDGETEVHVNDLSKASMYDTYTSMTSKIYIWGTRAGYYKSRPTKSSSFIYAAFFAAATVLPAIWIGFLSFEASVIIGLIIFVPSLIIFVIRNYKTQSGILLNEKISGLKLFIDTAKKDQLNMLQTPMSKQEIFEKYLPYAMVFNLHKSWADVFKDMNLTQPSWYSDPYGGNMFSTLYFVNNMNFISNSVNTAFSAPTNSGSSGFGDSIGGGFSGGGGGSW